MPSLSYAGVELLFDWNHSAQSFLDKFSRLEDLLKFPEVASKHTWQTNPVGDKTRVGEPILNFPDPPPLRLNRLYFPCTGATRWAYGIFLCTTEQKNAIEAQDCTVPHDLVSTTSTNPPEPGTNGSDDPECELRVSLYALQFRRFSGVKNEPCEKTDDVVTGNDLYLLILVDSRWFLQFVSMENIKSILYTQDESCVTSCSATWNDIFQWLGTVTNSVFSYYTQAVAYEYFGVNCEQLNRNYENAAMFLDAVCASVGARYVKFLNGNGQVQHPSEARAVLQNNLQTVKQQIAGYDCLDITTKVRPKFVKTAFPKLINNHPVCDNDYYAISVPTPSAGEGCGPNDFGFVFHDTTYADYGGLCDTTGTPGNESDLTELATQIESDYYDWTEFTYDFTFNAPRVGWIPCGFDDHILYSFGIEEDSHLFATTSIEQGQAELNAFTVLDQQYRREHQTRVQSLPINVKPDSLWHGTDALVLPDDVLVQINSCWDIDTCCTGDNCLPHAAANPVYWCDCEWVPDTSVDIYVYSATAFPGDATLEASIKGMFCGSSSGDDRKCLPIQGGNCGDKMWARWDCQSNRYHVTAKWENLWRFVLNEDLCSGGCAEATLLLACCGETEPTETGITFTVCDKANLICDYKMYPKPAPTESSGDDNDCRVQCGCVSAGTQGVARFWDDTCTFELLSIQTCDVPMFAIVTLQDCLGIDDLQATIKPDTEEFPTACGWYEKIRIAQNSIPTMGCDGDKALLMRNMKGGSDACWLVVTTQLHKSPLITAIEFCNGQSSGCGSLTKSRFLGAGVHLGSSCGDCDGPTDSAVFSTQSETVVVGPGSVSGCQNSSGSSCFLNMSAKEICVIAPCEGGEDEPQEISGWELETMDVVTGVEPYGTCGDPESSGGLSTCQFNFVTQKICGISCGSPESTPAWTFVGESVITYIGEEDGCLVPHVATIFTPCLCQEDVGTAILCSEECTSTSS